MRVVHLSWLLSHAGGGVPPVVFAVAREQRRLGLQAEVLGVQDRWAAPLGGASVARCVGPVAWGWSPGLRAALFRSAPDLLHLHGLFTWSSVLASGWAASPGHPSIVTPHGMLEPWALQNSRWKKRLARVFVEDRNLRRARCLQALCPAEAANLRKLPVRNPIAVVPNGVDLAEIPSSRDRGALGVAFPAIGGRRVLLFLGRIHPKKGLLPLVEAWGRLRARGAVRDWVLLVGGPDQRGHRAEIAARVEALGLQGEVILAGPLYGPSKQAALAGASAFVLPSYSEGFSMAVLEAMAWGLPVVISRPCNLDVETPGMGLLCDPDAASIADALGILLESSDGERSAMGARGRGEVERRYTWPRIAKQLAQLYRWILGGGERPGFVESAS